MDSAKKYYAILSNREAKAHALRELSLKFLPAVRKVVLRKPSHSLQFVEATGLCEDAKATYSSVCHA